MKYILKSLVIVLISSLGILFSIKHSWSNKKIDDLSDSEICSLATFKIHTFNQKTKLYETNGSVQWSTSPTYFKYVVEAKRRNLLCNNPTNISLTWSWYKKKSDKGDLVARKSLSILEKDIDGLIEDLKRAKKQKQRLYSKKSYKWLKFSISEIDVKLKSLENRQNQKFKNKLKLSLCKSCLDLFNSKGVIKVVSNK